MFNELVKYAEETTGADPEWMQWVKTQSAQRLLHDDLISGSTIGRLLALLVSVSGAKNVLELGTFTGYSTLWMASALPEDGKIWTVDSNLKYLAIAREAFIRSPWSEKIDSIHANASEWICSFSQSLDFVYLDADKRNYPHYFSHVKNLLKPGGILLADNVFWKGEVLKPVSPKSEILHQFNTDLSNDPAFETFFLPVRDGLLVARKKQLHPF